MAEGDIERGHAVCWGHLLSGGTTPACVPVPIKAGPSFRERFCTTCRARGVQINAFRLRVVCSGCVPTNKHGGGCWNEGPDADGWPPHRVVNQTINCIGPPIVILKFATSAPLHRLGEFPHGSCGWYTFRIGRTLAPLLGPHAHPPPLALAPTAGVMHMTPPTLPATLTETGRTLDEPVSSASLWTQGQRITSQASLTSTEPSHVIGIPLHEAIPGVFFSPQVISPRDELQQHRSAALHSAAIAAAAATSAAAAASSVARSFAAAYDLPLAGLASVPTGLASCATAPAQPGHASMVDTTSPTDLLQRLRTAGVLTAGEVARSEACVQQFSPSARLDSLDSLVLAASTSSLASWLLEILDDDQLIPVDLATAPAHASAVVRRGRCSDMQPSGGSLARPSQEPEAASEEREAPAKETADGLRSSGGATRTEAPRAERELLAKRRGCSSASRRK